MTKEEATREALELALGGMKKIAYLKLQPDSIQNLTDHYITAIKEALAQPDQERNFCQRCGKRLGKNDWDVHTCTPPQPEQEPVAWEGGEGWESLAWELCADENGEDSCNELIWEGGPIPEPWGDRWMKYEDEAKRLIALVQKHTTPPQRTAAEGEDTRRAWVGLSDDDAQDVIMKAMHSITGGENTFRLSANMIWVAVVEEVEAKLKEKNHG